MTLMATQEGAPAPSSFRMFRYADPGQINPAFDGAAFMKSWGRYVGSVHRHWQTRELVLCASDNGPHPQERAMLLVRLEQHPGNIGAVLAAVDARNAAFDARIASGAGMA